LLFFGFYRFRRYMSVSNLIRLFLAENYWKREKMCLLHLRGLQHPIYVRARTSDCTLVRTIFMKGGGEYPVFEDYAPSLIIDAGANIGLATVFFKKYYPDATVFAIEPDEDNCRLFLMNTAGYDKVHLLQGGLLADENQRIAIRNASADHYSYQVEICTEGLPVFSMNGVLLRSGFSNIDIAKIDIEGSEREVFSKNIEWLDQTDSIFIELHDHYALGSSQALLRAIRDKDFFLRFSGENVILTRSWYRWLTK
jgi:FkbM family methyltransferase